MAQKKTNGKRNRSAGHQFERDIIKLLQEAGFSHVVTCRAESKNRDDCGVDIMNGDERKNGKLPYNIQCKTSTNHMNYVSILNRMPDEEDAINVIFHRYTEKAGESDRFMVRGHYAILDMHDFIKLVERLAILEKELARWPAQCHMHL